jgi:amidase
MTFEEYRQYDATGLAQLVHTGAVTPLELLEIAIARAEAVNPAINAIIHKMYDDARVATERVPSKSAFAGVPFLVKDLGLEIKDQPLRLGNRGFSTYVSPRDSYVTEHIRAAGLVIMGKTNTPEFGLTPFTEPQTQGPTRNPHSLEHTPGGSSGGSASAVAAGIVPIATANDGGGSIRIPAACCGLFGLKPSRGRVSWGRLIGDMWNGAAVEGCVSRSVRDSAAYLDAISGMMPGDPYGLPDPTLPYAECIKTQVSKLTIGYTLETPMGTPVEAPCREAVQRMADTLRQLGHTVEEVPPVFVREDLTKAFMVIVASEAAGELRLLRKFLGRSVRQSDVEPNTYALGILGENFSGGEYAFAKKGWNDLARRAADFHQKYDLMLTPTLGMAPFKIGALQNNQMEAILVKVVNSLGFGWAVRQSIDQLAAKIYGYMPWTAMANMTGQPSMSIPTLRTAEGLPVGTMFTAPIGREDVLFNLATQLEATLQWDKPENRAMTKPA